MSFTDHIADHLSVKYFLDKKIFNILFDEALNFFHEDRMFILVIGQIGHINTVLQILYLILIGHFVDNFLENVLVDFLDNLHSCLFLLDGRGESILVGFDFILGHFLVLVAMLLQLLEQNSQIIFEFLWPALQQVFLALSLHDVHFRRTQENVCILVVVEDIAFFNLLPFPQHPIHHWEWSPQEILLGDNAHHLESVHEWLCQNVCEQVDCVR